MSNSRKDRDRVNRTRLWGIMEREPSQAAQQTQIWSPPKPKRPQQQRQPSSPLRTTSYLRTSECTRAMVSAASFESTRSAEVWQEGGGGGEWPENVVTTTSIMMTLCVCPRVASCCRSACSCNLSQGTHERKNVRRGHGGRRHQRNGVQSGHQLGCACRRKSVTRIGGVGSREEGATAVDERTQGLFFRTPHPWGDTLCQFVGTLDVLVPGFTGVWE